MMGGSAANTNILADEQKSSKLLDLLAQHGVKEIDTARVYGKGASEAMLGTQEAHKRFAVSTKAPAFSPGTLSKDNIRRNCEASLKALRQDSLDIYYLHGPDAQTPFTEQCAIVDELYKEGKFKRFGISNLTSSQVQEVYDICKSNKYVLPTVYQGGYNPILRTTEAVRLPLFRKLGIAFYAYSPLAGGFLAKPLDQILNPAEGSRFEAMSVFGDIYCNDDFINGVEQLNVVLKRHDMTTRNAALRWLRHHSALQDEDAIVLGASSVEQAAQNLADCDAGPLPEDVIEAMETLWESVKYTKIPYEPEPLEEGH